MCSLRCSAILITVGLLLIFGSSCSKDIHSFSIYEEDGVTIAETIGGPKYEGELFAYEEVLKLQQDPDQPESLLYRPLELAMDERGYFYVTDSGHKKIAVFDTLGQYSHSIGRAGGGPGEFNYPRIQSVQNGIISVYDRFLRRTSRFKTDGTLIDITTVPVTTDISISAFYLIDDDRHLMLADHSIMKDGFHQNTAATMLSASSDTIWSIQTQTVQTGTQVRYTINEQQYRDVLSYPFGCFPMCVYQPNIGIVVSTGWIPELEIYDLAGSLRLKVKIALEPEPITYTEQSRIRSFFLKNIEETEYSVEVAKSRLENLRFPESKAPWRVIEVDDAGFIWLRKTVSQQEWLLQPMALTVNEEWEENPHYLIVSPEGEYLGFTQRPEATGPVKFSFARNGYLLTNGLDAVTNENEFKIYRIIPAVEGLEYP